MPGAIAARGPSYKVAVDDPEVMDSPVQRPPFGRGRKENPATISGIFEAVNLTNADRSFYACASTKDPGNPSEREPRSRIRKRLKSDRLLAARALTTRGAAFARRVVH